MSNANFQVMTKDRYGRNDIITVLSTKGRPESEWKTAEEAFEAAKRYVHEKNRSGPMTFDEQKRLLEHLVFVLDEGYYIGNLIHGKHRAFVKNAEKEIPETVNGVFYAGQTPDNKPWIFNDPRGQMVTNLKHGLLEDKTIVFVHPL